MSILPLTDAVRAQIQSSVQITSLADVVEELVKNSLDANATTVEIDVDFARGFCSVQDDGVGIPSTEFSRDGNLARSNCTSKSNHAHAYGFRGCFLANLSSLSLTSIYSSQQGAQSASSAILGHSAVLSRLPQTDHDESRAHGTKVTVNNLFGNIPVRFKHLASRYQVPIEEDKAFDNLKKLLVAYLLVSPKPLNLRLRTRNRRLKYFHRPLYVSSCTGTSAFELPSIENILSQANFTNPSLSAAWKLASAKAGPVSIRAAICTVLAPSKQAQFVAFGDTPLSSSGFASVIYETINSIFDSSNFSVSSVTETASPQAAMNTYPALNQPGLGGKLIKAVDRWPRFFIRVDNKSSTILKDVRGESTDHGNVSPALQSILDLLKTLLIRFLKVHDLKSKSHKLSRSTDTLKLDCEARSSSSSVYRSWKRVKPHSGRKRDTQEGLPFTTQDEPPISEIALGSDVRLLLGDIDLDDESTDESSGEAGEPSIRFAFDRRIPNCEGAISWMDPRTGQSLQVDLNNGFILPYSSSPYHNAEPDDVEQQDKGQSFPRLVNPPSSRAELVQRLKNWPSAAFQSTSEQSIPSAVVSDESTAFSHKTSGDSLVDQNLDIDQLADAIVLGQVDAKYILVMAPTKYSQVLILVDQHAADERIKVEGLFQELDLPNTLTLAKPIKFEVSSDERRMFEQNREAFAAWGIMYDATGHDGLIQLPQNCSTVTVTQVPAIISERCRLEPKLLIELLRKEIWSPSAFHRPLHAHTDRNLSWFSKMSSCPEGLVEMVNSRACRTAIMFNDHLSHPQCKNLIRQLSRCVLPFQCAHGRPSLVVVGNVGYERGIGIDLSTEPKQKVLEDFGNAFRKWCELDTAG